MKSKFDAFRNHMVYMNLKNSNVKMSYSIQNGFQCKWATKNDQEEEKMALDILKITMEYWWVLKQQENKKYKVVYFLSFHDISFRDNDSISFSDHSSLCMQYLYN